MEAILDTDKVWSALTADAKFKDELWECLHPLMRDLVDDLPTALKEHLDRPVTLESLLLAKLALIDHLCRPDYIRKMATAFSSAADAPEDLVGESLDVVIRILSFGHALSRSRLRVHIKSVMLACLTDPSIEPKLMIVLYSSGFNTETLAAYEVGTLTIRGLLELQPSVLLLSDN